MSDAVAVKAGGVEERLVRLLSRERVRSGADAEPWRVAGRRPRAVAFPESAEEVAGLVALAREEGWAVEPAGAGTWLRSGNPGRSPDLVVSMSRMDRIVQYEPGDLTLTGGAGLALDALAERAGPERQWLPQDAPGTGGTLGALAATGAAGPFQAGYGAPRDLILGLDVVTGRGERLRLGGQVVKNVAGFDLVRLFVGSRGTLGIVTAVTVRLYPRPARDRTWVLRGAGLETLLPVARRLATAAVTPAALEVVERKGGLRGEDSATLAVRLVGSADQVAAEAALLEGAAEAELTPLDEDAAAAFWRDVRDLEEAPDMVLRMTMPPAAALDLLHVARALGRVKGGRDELERSALVSAYHATTGVLRVAVPNVRTDSGWDRRWAERLQDLRRTLEARGGSLVIAHGPPAVVERAGAWGDAGATAHLVQGLKDHFDPDGILAPGRFVVPVTRRGLAGSDGDDEAEEGGDRPDTREEA